MKPRKSSSSARDGHPSMPELRQLLARESEIDDGSVIAKHLDSCCACQESLTRLAADDSWWHETKTLLQGNAEPRWEPDLTAAYAVSTDGTPPRTSSDEDVAELFAEPTHPELLGRLGRYDIERVIGSGGMGIVVKAYDSELNRPIAIKLLAPHLAHVGAARERFAREGRAAAAVVHEHVVAIYNVESDGKAPFLVMQFVPGRSLQTRVDEDGPMSVEEILRIGMQAAAGLEAAHKQGLVHRDVKPANILLENDVERAILTDFGLARTIDDASLTQTGVLAGTPDYMAPEQALGELIDCRSDLFSLGAVLYFMATGHPPFRAPGAMAVLHRVCNEKHTPVWRANRNIPDELSELIDRLLEKKPSRRPAAASAVQEELADLLSRRQQGRRPRLSDAWRSRRLRRQLLRTVAAIAALSAVTATVIWRQASATVEERAPQQSAIARPDAGAVAELKSDASFYGDVEQTNEALEQLNQQTHFLQGGDRQWWDAAARLQRDLNQLEVGNLNSPGQ